MKSAFHVVARIRAVTRPISRRVAPPALGLVAAASLVAGFGAATAAAQATTFTYQGALEDGGAPAAGPHDLRFRLFDTAMGGTQFGPTICLDDVEVIDGTFSALLDFGPQFATTAERHLEIEVRRDTGLTCGDGAGFVALSPRQWLTAAPRASHANSAFALDAADGTPLGAVIVDGGGNVGIGTPAPVARLDVRGGPMLVENLGDQADLLWLASERSWVFRQEGVGAAAALKLASIGGGGNKNFIVETTGLMGVGTAAPTAKLDVRGDIRLGASGQYQAAGGTETLRLARGTIDDSGAILAGTGFTASRVLQGVYRIDFTTAFSGVPSVTVTPRLQSGLQHSAYTWLVSATGFNVYVYRNSTTPTDTDFDFCVIGPR